MGAVVAQGSPINTGAPSYVGLQRGCHKVARTGLVRYLGPPMESTTRDGKPLLDEVERVLSSASFARSDRASRLLRFLVERHIEGRYEELKESLSPA
jgi:hypothetical protein